MTTGLRLLVVEDAPDEAELMVRQLSHAGLTLDWCRVDTEAEYLTALGALPDLILADWRLPRFSGLRALHLMRDRGLDIPFIIVSGSIGEEAAVDAMRQGAYDYVLKDRPARLGQAVEHALEDKRLREERRQAETDLRASEERYRKLLEMAPIGIAVHRAGKVVYANPAGVRILGGTDPDEVVGRAISDIVHPDRLRAAADRIRRMMAGEQGLYPTEDVYVRFDGTPVEVEVQAAPAVNEGEGAVQVIVQDITERRRSEQALRESEDRFRRLAENAPDLIYRYRLTPERGFEYVSPAATELTGYTPEDHYADPDLGFRMVHPDDRPMLIAAQAGQVDPQRPLRLRWVRKDGRVVWTEQRNVPIVDEAGQVVALEGIARDVTANVQAEADLRRRAAEMEGLYQTSMQTLAAGDLHGLLTAILQRATELTGGDRGAIYLPTQDGSRLRLHISLNLGRDYTGVELALGEGASGRAALERRTIMIGDYDAWDHKSPAFSDSGVGRVLAVPMLAGERLVGVLNVADLSTGSYGEDEIRLVSLFADQAAMAIEGARLLQETHQRAAYLEALTDTAEALRAAVTPETMYVKVLEHVVRQLRAAGASISIFERDPGETVTALGVGAWEGTTGMRLKAGEGIVGSVALTGEPYVSDDVRSDPLLARPDLLAELPAVACVPLTVEDRTIGCVMIGRPEPVTSEELRLLTGLAEIAGNAIYRARVMSTLEDRVRVRTQELEAANERLTDLDRMKNEFVSNVTHELRTPITNILLYLDLARRTDSAPKQSHYFDVLKSESLRLGKLIEEVLTLSRLERGATPTDREPHSLEGLLADVRVAHQARADAKGLRLEHVPDIGLPPVPIQRTQIHQVLSNLVGNAVAYTPPGGQIRLMTSRTRVAGREYAGATVHNTGTYVPPEEVAHLFERFYRGSVGQGSGEPGSGLGLAISKEIIELHHGWIEVESDPDSGTAFTIWLPLDESPPGVGRASPQA